MSKPYFAETAEEPTLKARASRVVENAATILSIRQHALELRLILFSVVLLILFQMPEPNLNGWNAWNESLVGVGIGWYGRAYYDLLRSSRS